MAVASGDRVLGALAIKVSRDPANARAALKKVEPGAALELSFADNQLVIKGETRSVEEAIGAAAVAREAAPQGTHPLNESTFAGHQQINIRVRFAEVSRNDLFRLGINWSAMINPGSFALSLVTGTFLQPTGVNTNETFGEFAGSVVTRRVNINALLDALQRQGVLTTLAEPNLTAVSGETAHFLAGGEIPIPVPQFQQTITIQYKPFGVSLGFTPVLLPDDRIGMRVEPEVSALSSENTLTLEGFTVPALIVRRADTTVEVGSGESFAIAGLFQRDTNNGIDKFPILGDLPVLGQLFRSVRFQRNETELVIVITPYVVRPTPRRDLPLPTDRLPGVGAASPARPPGNGLAGFIVN
jgi:pilus assembly protein CpaC